AVRGLQVAIDEQLELPGLVLLPDGVDRHVEPALRLERPASEVLELPGRVLPAEEQLLLRCIDVQAEHGRTLVGVLQDDAVVERLRVLALVVVLRQVVRDAEPALVAPAARVVVAVPLSSEAAGPP